MVVQLLCIYLSIESYNPPPKKKGNEEIKMASKERRKETEAAALNALTGKLPPLNLVLSEHAQD